MQWMLVAWLALCTLVLVVGYRRDRMRMQTARKVREMERDADRRGYERGVLVDDAARALFGQLVKTRTPADAADVERAIERAMQEQKT